jgi:NADH-quinone oxidoreductase subunit N
MISANNLLILYVGLELLSLALYGLVAIDHNNVRCTEAAMKFFILGALASGLLLYGISFIYGATGGNLQLDKVFYSIHESQGINHSMLVFGLVFIVAGLVFKLGLAPFHMWIPDVYEGSPLPVTTIIGTVTKIAAVIFILRFLINGLAGISNEWSVMLALLAFISVFIGNIIAIAQTNIKRMLGYSTIAHMGFLAFGLMTVSVNGLVSVLFYLLTYVLTALAGFGVLIMLSGGGRECEKIDDLKGLSKTHPMYAGVMLLVMFSLAGIPPLVGFYAKFKILESLVEMGYIRTAIYAVVMSLIGAFYYLRVVKVMYFDDNVSDLKPIRADGITQSVVIINGLLLLVLGIVPTQVLSICAAIVSK